MGWGASFPANAVSSSSLAARFGVDEQWILSRTGIKERRILGPSESILSHAEIAAKQALQPLGNGVENVDLVISCTNSPECRMPSSAAQISSLLGFKKDVPCFDLVSACAGWMMGIETARRFVESGAYSNVLVIGMDATSRSIDPNDKNTAILFGDGAGAALVSNSSDGSIIDIEMHSDGKIGSIIQLQAPENLIARGVEVGPGKNSHTVKMDGEAVVFYAVSKMVESSLNLLNKHSLKISDIDWFVPHQANAVILEFVVSKLGIDKRKVATNLEQFGNTSAATIPTCISQWIEAGKIKRGELLLLTTFGAGASWGSALIRL